MSLLEDHAPSAPTAELDEPRLRTRARWRAWFCPGAGWAILGRGRWTNATFFAYLVFLASLAWLIVSCSPPALWLSIATFVVALTAWSGEIAAVRRAAIQPDSRVWLARRFWPALTLVVLASLGIPALLAREFGWTIVADMGMSPTLEAGERVLFRRRIVPRDLRAGAVVLFRLPPQTRVGEPGMPLVGRLLAVPGDSIAIRKGKYVVNGETTDYLADTKPVDAAIDIPKWPQTLKVRDEQYFVVQDSPRPGIDSRQWSWIYDRDLTSARLIHVRGERFLQPVD